MVRLRHRAAEDETRDKLAQLELRSELKAAQKDAEIHRLRFVELTQMQAKLVEAEKMAQLGMLAAGTAHELNTPLGVLRSNLGVFVHASQQLADFATGNPEAPAERLSKLSSSLSTCEKTSTQAIERISAVAASYKRFTQLDLADQGNFDLREGLQSALSLLTPHLPQHVEVETNLDAVPLVTGWPGQLNQAFLTLLQNAVDAIGAEPGKVSIATVAEPAGRVTVRISDSGRGMSEQELEHLFDVGWSAAGKRTKMRLGLAAARAAVQRHQGLIRVSSAMGEGTTFELEFPISETASDASPSPAPPPAAPPD